MAHFLSIPENVMNQHLLPCLDHNDILRLRRVSKQIKIAADAYLWTPKTGHQGKWELKIDSSEEGETLEAFLRLGLPPPSRLYIANKAGNGASKRRSLFENKHLEEFMRRYSKYVTNLRIDKLFIPFTSVKEIGFYESLENLEKLRCYEMITVGGTAHFEEKSRNAEGSFLIRPTFKKLKIFKLDHTDCMDSMWNFINGVSTNLKELLHPFHKGSHTNQWGPVIHRASLTPVQQLIERRGLRRKQSELVYDWRYLLDYSLGPLELLRVFASCRDHDVVIKNLRATYLNCIFSDENGRIVERVVKDPVTGEWTRRVNYQRNEFVESIIDSVVGVHPALFLMKWPVLKKITIKGGDIRRFWIPERSADGYPPDEWPNLRKMDILADLIHPPQHYFRYLWRDRKLPKLEELSFAYRYKLRGRPDEMPVPNPWYLQCSCRNIKKLTLKCYPRGDNFFIELWEELPLLEHVTLDECFYLKNHDFAGLARTSQGALKLQKLKHLALLHLEAMPGVTNAAFRNALRHLKLSSFELSSEEAIDSISMKGIKDLLTGEFAETIQKLNLDQLKLKDVSEEELKHVVGCFRSSKML